MSRSFNLTAELNLRGPSNIRPIIADIRRQLTGITANVNVTVNNTTTRNVNNLQQSVTRLNAALTATRGTATNATAALNAFARAAANVNNNIGNIPRNLTRINTGAGATTTTLNQVTRATQQATVGFEDFGRQSALAVRRFAAFATVTSVIYRFTNAITSATSEFIDFNRELVRVAQVTDSSLSELRPLVSQITNLSTSLGIASQDLIQVSSTLAQAGLSARDTEKALKALALSALAPSFDSLSDTVEGSIALMRQFGISAGDLEGALGSVNAVAAKFAVEASDLITAIQRTGGVFATASKGVTEGKDALNEFLAVFTSVRATTRESAETIATGLRTIFTRIQRADTIKALKEFGVTLTDLQGKFVGPYEAVRRLSEGLSRLDPRDLRFSQIVEELGGFRQIGKVIPLIQQFATAQAALKVAQQGQGSLAKDASTAQQSLANQIAKVREEFTALIRSLGESSTFQTFVRLSLDLASALIRLADSAKTVLPALTAIAAFRGVSALTRFGAGFAGGLRRQNNGGPVRGFASGGLVPGQGNSDTVPAMLTAGEFVIRKKAVQRIGVANLHKINRRAAGGKIKDLLPDKPLLRNKYDTSDIEDLYSLIRIDRSKQNKLSQSREQYRQKAEKIWSQASSAFATKGSLSGANTLIRRKTGINLPSKLSSKELTPGNKDKQRLNKIQGSLAEKEAYDRMGNLRQLPTQAGADFAVGGSPFNFVEVKNRLEPTSDNDLRGKALLGHQYLSGKQYLNNKLDKTPRLTISLLSSNPQDYKKKNLGGLIQKFTRGGKGKALGARSRFKELDASKLDKLSTADLIKYAKRQARDVFSTVGAGMVMRSRFIETPANKITPELEPHLTSYMGKKGFWREEIAPFGRPSKQQAAKASKTGREEALKKQEARQADEVAARAQQWKLIRSGSKIDSYLLSSLKEPILSDYKSAKAGQPLAKAFHETRLRQAVNKTLDDFDDFDYSPAKIDKLVSGMAAKRFGRGGKASSDFTGYHGSAHIFSKIDASKLGKRGANLYGAGFNIAMDRGMAKSYAKKSGAVYPVTVKGGISDFIEANSLLSENPKALQSIQKIFKQQKIPVKGLEQLTFKDASNKLTETLLERIEKKLPKKPGVDANSRFMEAFGIASQKVRQLMVVGGIPGTKVTINRPLDEQMAVAYDLDRLELGKPLKSKRFARGGSVEDKVPALLTPGEFVINKKAAGRIGASRLHQLNRADRIQGFNKGGAVGYIPKFQNGGGVFQIAQDLIKQGRSLAEAMAIARQTVTDAAAKAPKQSMSGTADADRLSRRMAAKGITSPVIAPSNQSSFQQFNANATAIQADKQARAPYAGIAPSPQQIVKNQAANARQGGNVNLSSSGQQFAMQIATVKTPLQQFGQNLVQLGRSFSSVQATTASLGQAAKMAGSGLLSVGKAAGRSAGGLISKVGGGVLGAVGLGGLSSRGAAGGAGAAMGGGGGGMMGMVAMMAAGPLLDAASQSMGGEKTEAGRNTAAVGGAVMNYAAIGATLGSVIPGVGTALGGVVGAAAGLVVGLQDAKKANEEYAQSQREATAATASDKSGKALEAYMAKPGAAQKQAFMSAFAATSQAEAAVGAGTQRRTASSFGKMLGYEDENINEFAARRAKTQTAGADQAQQFLANEMMRTGKSFGEVSKTMSPDQFKTLAANIAEADETYAYFQIQRANEIKKLREGGKIAEANALQAETNAEQEAMAKNIAERKLAEASAAAQAKAAAEASKKLNMVMMQAVMSLEKSFNTMEEVLNKSSFELGQISGKADEIFSGKASLTSSTFAQTNNVLQNPNAYSAAERQNAINSSASRMGPAGALVGRVATFGAQATEEASRRANAVFNAGGTNEEVGGEVTRSLTNNILATFGPNSSMSQTLIDGVKRSVDEAVKTAKENGETLDPNELIEKATGPLNKAAQQAGQLLIKNNENVAKHLEELGKVAERVVEIENRRADRTAALVEMQAQGGISTKEALGQKVSLDERIGARFAGSRARLGIQGQANFTPQNIANMRSQAQREQAALQSQIDRKSASVGSDPTGRAAREVGNLQLKLAKVNSTIEQTNKELESLPGALEGAISDVTSEIQNRVAKLDAQKQAAGAFAEKLVGSTPQELMELSRTFDLLNNTLRGQVTTIQQSQVAQQAYIQSIQEGKTAQEAMADAQTAFANENKKALSLFGELTQIAGIEGPELDLMKADLLENFARSQGAGLENNPFFQGLLKKLRESPEDRAKNDPVLKALQQRMTELREQQVEAVRLQNEADRNIQQQLLKDVGDNIIKSLKETQTAFVNAMNDIAMRMGAAPPRPMPARPRSTGGLIYASNGQFVNFEPKGTDTVPAMLTPGEFVVNAKSTKENLGLLMAINNSRGGRISYLADGGMPDISGVSSRTQSAKQEDMARSGLINQRSLSNKIDTVKSLSNNINSTTSFTKDNQIPSLDGSIDNNQSANNKQFKSLLVGVNKISSVIEKSMGSQGLSRGGVVYANSGGYIGNGTPAMLSPGEFVVNQASTKRYGGILQAINREDGGGTPFNAPVLDMTGGQQNKNGVFVRTRYRGPKDFFMSDREAKEAGIPYSKGVGSNTEFFDKNNRPISRAEYQGLQDKDEQLFNIFTHPTLASQSTQTATLAGFAEGIPVGAATTLAAGAAYSGTALAAGVTAPAWLPIAAALAVGAGTAYLMSKYTRDTSNALLKASGSKVTMEDIQETNPASMFAGQFLGEAAGGAMAPTPDLSGLMSFRQARLQKFQQIQKRRQLYAAVRDYRARVVKSWEGMSELRASVISRKGARKMEELFPDFSGDEIIDIAAARLKLLRPDTSPDDYLPLDLQTRVLSSYDPDGGASFKSYGKRGKPTITTSDPAEPGFLPHESVHAMFSENPHMVELTRNFIKQHEDLIAEWLSKTKMDGYNLDTIKYGTYYQMKEFGESINFRTPKSQQEIEEAFARATGGQSASFSNIRGDKRSLEYIDRMIKQNRRFAGHGETELLEWVNKNWDRTSLDSLKKTLDDFRLEDWKLYQEIQDYMGDYPAGVGPRRLSQDLLDRLNKSQPTNTYSSFAQDSGTQEFLTMLAESDLTGNVAGQKLMRLAQQEIFRKADQIKYKFMGFPEQPIVGVPREFNKGGIVYASEGRYINFKPKGTDTVPAMLTPGEFVVNAKATKDNLSTLQAINTGYYETGGIAGVDPSPSNFARGIVASRMARIQNLPDKWVIASGGGYFINKPGKRDEQTGKFLDPETDFNNQPLRNGPVVYDINQAAYVTGATSVREASQLLKEKYPWWRPGRGRIVEAKKLYRSGVKQNNLQQNIIDELFDQMREAPYLFGRTAFYLGEPGPKFAAISQKITEGRMNVAEGYRKATKRQNYLRHVMNNTNLAYRILPEEYLKKEIPGQPPPGVAQTTVKDVLSFQYQSAEKEIRTISQVWDSLISGNRMVNGIVTRNAAPAVNVPRDATTSFNALDPSSLPRGGDGDSSYFDKGGIVYANRGTLVPYEPRGTDTVPAMLTPGEFVVNRQASQKHLGLLQSINNGNYSRGGTVYLSEGTPGTQAFDANMTYLSDILKKGADTLNTAFIEAVRKLNNIADNSPQIRQDISNGVSNNQSNPLANIQALGNRLDQFIEQLKNAVPSTVTLEVPSAIPVNVTINGASVLRDLLGGPLGNIVQKAIKNAFDAKSRENEGY